MDKKSWQEIQRDHRNEWVHLIDYDWQEGEPYPSSGVVHVHAPSRHEFNDLLKRTDPIPGARLFVGKVTPPDGSTVSVNIVKMTPCG